jgi:peroxiredoxin
MKRSWLRVWCGGPLLLCALAHAADDSVSRMEQSAGKTAPPFAMEYRLLAAQALAARHPEAARRFIDTALDQLRAAKDATISPSVIRALAAASPDDAARVLPQVSPASVPAAITALAQTGHTAASLSLYREALAKGQAAPRDASQLLVFLARANSPETAALLREIVATYSFENLSPQQAWSVMGDAHSAESAAPAIAADVYERILKMVSAPDYDRQTEGSLNGTFQLGSQTVNTATSRDTLLLMAGSYLRILSPGRAAKFQDLLSRWDLSQPVRIRSIGIAQPGGAQRTADMAAVFANIAKLRGLATDADRARLVIEIAGAIRALPAGSKLGPAVSLASRSTEGNLGKAALTAVAGVLGEGIRESASDVSEYVELAKLVRYEHIAPPITDPALDAAGALLALRDSLMEEIGFTLESLDGKTYSLESLKGKVVLLNFWATWCPPCRKEMPDMEKLSREFAKKGLVVLAVSDENRDVVESYLVKERYSFPILLDPDRKVNTAFQVEGIPQSFVFDRSGKLAGHAIDMRTEAQFREILRVAGLQ